MAGSASVAGLASGIDWQQTIDLMMQIEQQPVDRLQNRKDEFTRKISAWDGLQTKLQALQTRSQGIDTTNELLTKTATSSNVDDLSVSASAGAVSGTHTVVVNQLAKNEVYVHTAGWADAGSTAIYTGSGGQFAYSFDGQSITLDVPGGSTLADLVSLINNDVNNPGITASLIDDGGATNPVHLVLSANDPAASDTLSIDDVATNLGTGGTTFDTANWQHTQNAQEAEIQVDGYPPSGWITRPSNVIDDVLTGVTMTLKAPSATGIQVTIADDYATVKQRINDWVTSYNDVMTDIATKTQYDSQNQIQGILMDDGRVKSVRSDMINIVASEIPGLPTSAKYSTLGSVGIDIGINGTLSVDDSKLQAALEDDMQGVADLFTFSKSSTNQALKYFTRTSKTQGGTYDVTASYKADGTLDSSGTNSIGGYAATVEGTNLLVGADNTPVEGLRIIFTNPGGGPGTVTGSVRIGTGVSVESDNKVDSLTDGIDGLIKLVKDSYTSQVENLDTQIEAYQARLQTKRDMLTREFTNMETAVSQAKSQSSWISAIGS